MQARQSERLQFAAVLLNSLAAFINRPVLLPANFKSRPHRSRTMRVPHFLLLALVCTASTVQAGIFDDIANGISTAAGAVVGAGATAVDGVVGVANDVGDAVVNAGQTAWNWTQNSAE